MVLKLKTSLRQEELFGEDRLKAAMVANRNASAQEMLEAIVTAVSDFTGDMPQADDLTKFIVKRLETSLR